MTDLLGISPLNVLLFSVHNFLDSFPVCYHAHHCELVCDNWCRKKCLIIAVFCERPEGGKKPQEQVREIFREVLVQMWIVYLYMYFVDSLCHSL